MAELCEANPVRHWTTASSDYDRCEKEHIGQAPHASCSLLDQGQFPGHSMGNGQRPGGSTDTELGGGV